MAQQMPPMQPIMGGQHEHEQQQGDQLAPASYYPAEPNDLTGGLPINLDSLRDGPPGSKPFYPYSTLIRYAIKGSPNQKLLLEDIYYAIESRFPYFKTAPSGWKNSVRHNLSLNPCFEKVARPLTDRGKGHYWTVNDTVDPRTGVHRVRKKKPKNKKDRNSEEADVDYAHDASYDDPHAQYVGDVDTTAARTPQAQFQYPPFDPNFPIVANGMRFAPPPQIPIPPDGDIDVDEHGNIDWRSTWLKELNHLQQVTAEQDKQQVDQEWYRMMLFRVRGALIAPLNPAETMTMTGQAHGEGSQTQELH